MSSHPLLDLGALRVACAPVIGCDDRFLLHGSLDVQELDEALASLRPLPRLPGRLGRAIELVASAGGGAVSTEEIIEALEVLRTTTSLRTPPSAAPPVPLPATRRRRRPPPPRLPGFG